MNSSKAGWVVALATILLSGCSALVTNTAGDYAIHRVLLENP